MVQRLPGTTLVAGVFILTLACVGALVMHRTTKRKHMVEKSAVVNYQIPVDKVTKKVLDNGLTVIVFDHPIAPKVLVQIAYDVGSAAEEEGERGLAHLIEHMIFKGTQKLAEGDIDGIARKYGASFNAFTSNDVTSYYFETTKSNWRPFLPLMADCMQNARFDEQHLSSEMLAVIQELKMYKDSYWNRLFEKAFELLFPANHPYHFPIIGYKEDLAALNTDRLKKFYKKYYHPSHAVLFIAGDVDVQEALKLAEESFGSVPAGNPAPLREVPHLIPDLASHVTTVFEDVQKERLAFYWYVPGTKYFSEDVINATAHVLGVGEGSRLYRRLVDEDMIADEVQAGAQQLAEGGAFLVMVLPKPGKIEECRNVIIEEINKLMKDGPTEAELQKVKTEGAFELVHSLEDLQHFVSDWVFSYFAHRNELAYFERLNRIQQITSDDVKKCVATFLDPFVMQQIQLSPLPENKKALWQSAKDQSDALDAKILGAHVRTSPLEEPIFVHKLPAPAPLTFDFPKPARVTTLDNGLKIIFYENHELPVIKLSCTFRDASTMISSREGILINLMMGMLVEGAQGMSKDEIVNFFEERGVEYAYDTGGARLAMLNGSYDEVIERFAHVLRKPKFAASALKKNQAISIEGCVHRKDSPKDLAFRQLNNLMYKGHSFEWTFDDAIADLEKVKIKDLETLHKKYIAPENMVISVAGDYDVDHLESVLKKTFSDWKGDAYKKREVEKRTFTANEKVDIPMLRDQVVLLYGRPSDVTLYDADYVPLKMLNCILFNSLGSRIFELRERSGLFYTAGGMFAAEAQPGKSYDYLFAILNPQNLDKAEGLLQEMFAKLLAEGVSDKELDEARQIYLKGLIDLVSRTDAVSGMGASLEIYGLPFDHYDKVLARVNGLTAQELNSMVKKYASMDRMARVRVGRV